MMKKEMKYPSKWRYCKVDGNKNPNIGGNGWQNRPLELNQIDSPGKGLLLGRLSGGVMALDFDGHYAWEWFEKNIGPLSLVAVDTPMWSSGRPGRCQIAFNVPEEHWSTLKTVKVAELIIDGRKVKHLEFRWTNAQSVLPPSPHPETGYYRWEQETNNVAMIPDDVLNYWLAICKPYVPPVSNFTVNTTFDTITIIEALKIIRNNVSRPDYDDWRDIAWMVATCVGESEAQNIMRNFWPEIKRGEYQRLFNGYNSSLSPKIGSLVVMARVYVPTFNQKANLEPLQKFRYAIARRHGK